MHNLVVQLYKKNSSWKTAFINVLLNNWIFRPTLFILIITPQVF